MDAMWAYAMGRANSGQEPKVFDWDKAAAMIANEQIKTAAAGLLEDWGYTAVDIIVNGELQLDDEFDFGFLASTWATPTIAIDGVHTPCWRLQSETPGWGATTRWPESARAILFGNGQLLGHEPKLIGHE